MKKTIGERVLDSWGRAWLFENSALRIDLVRGIDAAIKRARVKAWNEGLDAGRMMFPSGPFPKNPYRGRKRR